MNGKKTDSKVFKLFFITDFAFVDPRRSFINQVSTLALGWPKASLGVRHQRTIFACNKSSNIRTRRKTFKCLYRASEMSDLDVPRSGESFRALHAFGAPTYGSNLHGFY